jgi:uncharacterized protein with HEPN domain
MHEFILDKCELIIESIDSIESYSQSIKKVEDFKNNDQGFLLLDAIMMRLQVVGENIKKISKIDPTFFQINLQFDTNNIIRFRDFISHHYEKLDADIVFDICKKDIPALKDKIQGFINSNRSGN